MIRTIFGGFAAARELASPITRVEAMSIKTIAGNLGMN
jgi:hypothetical protein